MFFHLSLSFSKKWQIFLHETFQEVNLVKFGSCTVGVLGYHFHLLHRRSQTGFRTGLWLPSNAGPLVSLSCWMSLLSQKLRGPLIEALRDVHFPQVRRSLISVFLTQGPLQYTSVPCHRQRSDVKWGRMAEGSSSL